MTGGQEKFSGSFKYFPRLSIFLVLALRLGVMGGEGNCFGGVDFHAWNQVPGIVSGTVCGHNIDLRAVNWFLCILASTRNHFVPTYHIPVSYTHLRAHETVLDLV